MVEWTTYCETIDYMKTIANTEQIDKSLLDLDERSNSEIIKTLLASQQQAIVAVEQASATIDEAVTQSAEQLLGGDGRIILAGAGASGRLAVQDGAELWPTYGWPHERLLLCMAGGPDALLASVEGVEDNEQAAIEQVHSLKVGPEDVVLALAASGQSAWTCAWLEASKNQGAMTIGMANNPDTRLLKIARYPIYLNSGLEVLAGSTRMAAGTAQKIALNTFSTLLMLRMHRTFGNLMVDMAAVNSKLDQRRVRMLRTVLPDIGEPAAREALSESEGWVKLAILIALGDKPEQGKARLFSHKGSLRMAMRERREQEE